MKQFDAANFAIAVKLARHFAGLDLRELGDEIGVSASSLSRIENGKKPDVDSLAKLLHWMQLPLSRFTINAL